MSYKVIQHRTDRSQLKNPSVVVWKGNRRKEAVGQQKHNLNSALDMIVHHDYFDAHDFEVDLEKFQVTLYDEWGDTILYIWYELQEIDDYVSS